MPICSEGQIITIPVDVKILKPFAHEDRVYYIARPIKSLNGALWIVTTDGIPLEASPEVINKAYRIIGMGQ